MPFVLHYGFKRNILNCLFHNADVRCSWLPWRRLLCNFILIEKMSWKLFWHHTKIYRIKKQVDWVLCLYSDWECCNEGFALLHLLFLLKFFASGLEEMGLIWTPGCMLVSLLSLFSTTQINPIVITCWNSNCLTFVLVASDLNKIAIFLRSHLDIMKHKLNSHNIITFIWKNVFGMNRVRIVSSCFP